MALIQVAALGCIHRKNAEQSYSLHTAVGTTYRSEEETLIWLFFQACQYHEGRPSAYSAGKRSIVVTMFLSGQ